MTDSIFLLLAAVLGGILFLILLFAGYVALRIKAARMKKRLAVNTSSLRALRSKYGRVISEASKRYQPERAMPGAPVERHAKFFSEMDAIVDDYLRMTETERRALRYLLSHHDPVLRGYQYSVRSVLATTKERAWLQRGLAATSLEDCQSDFRDSIEALNGLLSAAERLGIDWRDDVAMAARLSDDTEPLGGGKGTPWKSTKAYLEGRTQRVS